MQNHILAADPSGRFSRKFKFDSGRYLEPGLACHHAGRHIRAAHACGECAQSAVCTSMGIRSDHSIPRHYQAFLRKQGMFDSHLSHIKVIGNIVPAGKFTAAFTVLSRFNILVRDKVIHNQSYFLIIKNGLVIHLLHLIDRNRRCDIIAQHQIQICFN